MSAHSKPIWPRVLDVLSAFGEPMTATQIAKIIGENERSVYASMSSLGANGNRWCIYPVRKYWNRKAQFALTNRGQDELVQYMSAA